jgi:allantoin racemase
LPTKFKGISMPRILVINPNSTETCTAAIDRACQPFRLSGGPTVDCITLAEGPPGIESQADSDSVIPHLHALVQREPADAYVVACFSDPGVHSLRERTGRPVFGIAEAGMAVALSQGERFGVLAILPSSVSRQRRTVRAYGLGERYAASRSIGLGVPELADGKRTQAAMIRAGERLRDEDGADVLILGCAGMADQRAPLALATGLPVVEPSQAALARAIGAVLQGW